ncbi:SPOSA6832_03499, partial [Sporobolomyces salmonicolor]
MAHELSVEGDKVIERDEHGNLIGEKNYEAVHRGYLAATHNPRVGSEAKHSAEKILHDLEAAHGGDVVAEEAQKTQHAAPAADAEGGGEVHRHRVIGGLKATLHRDDRSDEAKQHARDKLREMGVDLAESE